MLSQRVFRHARLATLDPARPGLGVIEAGAVMCGAGRIAFAGAEAELPAHDPACAVDCDGRWITPGLIALATDCNPDSSLLLTMNMAATLFRLTVDECIAGVTRNAARALGLQDRGTLEAGKWADLAIWDIGSPAELVWRIGFNPLHRRVWRGA